MNLPAGFEYGFPQSSKPSKVLPKRRAHCHVSDVNDVVVSRYP